MASLTIGLIVAGIIFEQTGRRRDRRRYPQIGQSIDIGSRSLNLYCSGKGGPTVVFDTFSHMAGYVWTKTQPDIARFTRACWFDRAGYGWSDSGGSPLFQSDSKDLHRLLAGAGEKPPYLLIAPGDAALRAIVYHSLYPSELAGILMLNPLTVEDTRRALPAEAMGPWARTFGSSGLRIRALACHAAPSLSAVGFFRLAAAFDQPRRTPATDLTPAEHDELDFLSDKSEANPEVCAREQNMDEAARAGTLADLPLIVLASHPQTARATTAWTQSRERLAALSSRGRLAWTEGSADAAAIANAIRELTSLTAAPPRLP